MAAEVQDIFIEFPWEILDACNGFALDLGGGVVKLVYVAKEEVSENNQREADSKGKLHIKSFEHDAVKDNTAFTFMKNNVYIKKAKENDPPTVCCTGSLAAVMGGLINNEFGIKTKCLNEMDCFVQSLVYLSKNLPVKHIIHAVNEKDKQLAMEEVKGIAAMMSNFTGKSSTTVISTEEGQKPVVSAWVEHPPLDQESSLMSQQNIFPCVMIICGSGCVALLVNEDSSFEIIDGSRRAGKLWMGMGSILTKAKNYNELMNLAESGSIESIDFTTKDFTSGKPPQGETNTPQQEAQTVYCFGKAANKSIDDFKREDLAKSYLNVIVADTVAFGMGAARIKNVQHVVYCGGFVNHPLMRQMIHREWMRRGVEISSVGGIKEAMKIYLFKNGSHMAAIGALLNHKLNFQV